MCDVTFFTASSPVSIVAVLLSEISSSNAVVGLGSVGPISLRACSKYIVNRTGLELSPCGVPTLLVNGFDTCRSTIYPCVNDCATQKELY